MSEYQYYEFRAIDKPLTVRQMGELRKLSTRAEITPTSFTNEYHWGNLRGNPRLMMDKYFDAFLYYANWGSHWLMLRLPRKGLDLKTAKKYCGGDSCEIRTKGNYAILEFHSEDESGDWDFEEDSRWLASLIPLRADLLGGDLRSLYLGWLASAQAGELDDDDPEPPVPPGLKRLSASLKSLSDFLRIDPKLLKTASADDVSKPSAERSQAGFLRWIDALPASEKNKTLLEFIKGDAPHLRERLFQRFRQSRVKTRLAKKAKAKAVARRTVSELLTAAGLCNDEQD